MVRLIAQLVVGVTKEKDGQTENVEGDLVEFCVDLPNDGFEDGNKSVDVLLDIGEALAAMGKGQAELDRIIVNLQQVGAIGYASMVDIKQFAYAGIPIFEMLQKQTGLAGDALADFISDGGVSFELLTEMFDKGYDKARPRVEVAVRPLANS